jgi:uncharacterized protein (TIGR03067 family)
MLAQAACTTNQPTAETQPLQGTWEGDQAGQKSAGKYTITITGNALRFQGSSTNDWYETTFTLPGGTNPQQLHATIKDCPQPDNIGKVVLAIFKIEEETLTLAGIQASATDPPKTFGEDKPQFKIEDGPFNFVGREPIVPATPNGFESNSIFRYDLKKVQPQKKNTEPHRQKT